MLYDMSFRMLGDVAGVFDFMGVMLKSIEEATRAGTTANLVTALDVPDSELTPAQKLHKGLADAQRHMAAVLAPTGTFIESTAETLQMAQLIGDMLRPRYSASQWKSLLSTTDDVLGETFRGYMDQKVLSAALVAIDGQVRQNDIQGAMGGIDALIGQMQAWTGGTLSRRMRAAPALRHVLMMKRLLQGTMFPGPLTESLP